MWSHSVPHHSWHGGRWCPAVQSTFSQMGLVRRRRLAGCYQMISVLLPAHIVRRRFDRVQHLSGYSSSFSQWLAQLCAVLSLPAQVPPGML